MDIEVQLLMLQISNSFTKKMIEDSVTIEELAKRSGISKQVIRNILSAAPQCSRYSLKQLTPLARALFGADGTVFVKFVARDSNLATRSTWSINGTVRTERQEQSITAC